MSPPAPADDPFSGMAVQESSPMPQKLHIPEVNALREWEDKHEQLLEEVARKEAKDKEARRQEGATQLQQFYAERKDAAMKKKAANRTEEETVAKSKAASVPAGGNP